MMSSDGFKIRNQHNIHFITCSVIQWIDVFSRKEYADLVVESLKYCQENKELNIHGWCVMSNHLHLVISTDDPIKLSDVIRDFKKFTSLKIIEAIEKNEKESRKNWMIWLFKSAGTRNNRNENYQFWQQSNHPIECSSNDIIEGRLKYLHENPIRAGIVRNEWDYVYSSAIDYYTEGKGLIDISFI